MSPATASGSWIPSGVTSGAWPNPVSPPTRPGRPTAGRSSGRTISALRVANLRTGRVRTLEIDHFAYPQHPTWSPDGRWIAFATTLTPSPAGHLRGPPRRLRVATHHPQPRRRIRACLVTRPAPNRLHIHIGRPQHLETYRSPNRAPRRPGSPDPDGAAGRRVHADLVPAWRPSRGLQRRSRPIWTEPSPGPVDCQPGWRLDSPSHRGPRDSRHRLVRAWRPHPCPWSCRQRSRRGSWGARYDGRHDCSGIRPTEIQELPNGGRARLDARSETAGDSLAEATDQKVWGSNPYRRADVWPNYAPGAAEADGEPPSRKVVIRDSSKSAWTSAAGVDRCRPARSRGSGCRREASRPGAAPRTRGRRRLGQGLGR